jgi:hypothetical protein
MQNFADSNCSTINVFDFLSPLQKEDVTSRTCILDTTEAINSAINLADSMKGGMVYFSNGTYLITGTLHASVTNLVLKGSGIGSTILHFKNGDRDCIVAQGMTLNEIFGWSLSDMKLTFEGKTGGQTVRAHYTNNVVIYNIMVSECWSLFDFFINKNINLRDIFVDDIIGGEGAYAIHWRAPSDGSERSDILTIKNFVANGKYSGCDGIVWDGLAHTLTMTDCHLLKFNCPFIIKNTLGNKSGCVPMFGTFTNLRIEGARCSSLHIGSGEFFKFNSCNIINESGQEGQNSNDSHAVTIDSDDSGSITKAIKFIGCTIGGSKGSAVFCDAKNVDFLNCDFVSNSNTLYKQSAAIAVASNANNIKILGCSSSIFNGIDHWASTFVIDSNARNVIHQYCSI